MDDHLSIYIRNTALLLLCIITLNWISKYYPIASGTFVPDLTIPYHIVLVQSSPIRELLGSLFVTGVITGPITGLIIGLFVGFLNFVFNRGANTEQKDVILDAEPKGWTWTKKLGVSFIILFLIALSINSSATSNLAAYASLSPATESSKVQSVLNPSDVSINEDQTDLSIEKTPQRFSNQFVSVNVPFDWQIEHSGTTGIFAGSKNGILNIEWTTGEITVDQIMKLSNDELYKEKFLAEFETYIISRYESKGAELIKLEKLSKSTIGDFPIMTETVFVGRAKESEGTQPSVSFMMFNAPCGTSYICTFSYLDFNELLPNEHAWNTLQVFANSLNVIENPN